MINPVRTVLSAIPPGPLHTVDRFVRDPEGTQRRVLRRLLKAARHTEWGRRLRFSDIIRSHDPVEAFRQAVPFIEYDAIRDDVGRVRDGASDVFSPGVVRNFAVSSGTVARGKLLPVTDRMLAFNNRFSVGVVLQYLRETGSTRLLGGKHLTLPGRIERLGDFPGVFAGEVSGLQAAHAPKFFRHLFQAVPNSLSFLPNWEHKLDAIVRHTLHQDIRLVVMVPSWAIVFFPMLFRRFSETTGRTVHSVADVWPNLELFISGGVALGSYRNLLDEMLRMPGLHYLETYGASEGFLAFQSDLTDPAMLLHLDNGLFYEFVRVDHLHRPDPPRIPVWEVEVGVRYTLCLSTAGGLWGYHLGDIVRFTGTNPHKIVVTGRTNEVLDRYGEMVFAEEAVEALQRASLAAGALVRNFHVTHRAPQSGRLPAHEWLIEFEHPPQNLQMVGNEIDAYLVSVNRHYAIRREARAFDGPSITLVPKGAFHDALRKTRQEISSQTKVPRFGAERRFADCVIGLLDSSTASNA